MLSTLLFSPLKTPYPVHPLPAHYPKCSHFPEHAFPYTRSMSLLVSKGLSSHWCPTRPSSATHATGARGPSFCTLWVVIKSLGGLEGLVGSYFYSSYGAANTFSSLGPSSRFSIGDHLLSSITGWEYPLQYFSGTGRASHEIAISCSSQQALIASTIVSGFGKYKWDDSQVGQSLNGIYFSLCLTLCLCIYSHWYFVMIFKKQLSSHTLALLLLEIYVVCELYLVPSELMSTY